MCIPLISVCRDVVLNIYIRWCSSLLWCVSIPTCDGVAVTIVDVSSSPKTVLAIEACISIGKVATMVPALTTAFAQSIKSCRTWETMQAQYHVANALGPSWDMLLLLALSGRRERGYFFPKHVDVMTIKEASNEKGLDRARQLSEMSASSSPTSRSLNFLSV